jgi:hypothetical protein
MKRGTTPVLITSSIGGLRSTEINETQSGTVDNQISQTHTEGICISVNHKSRETSRRGNQSSHNPIH